MTHTILTEDTKDLHARIDREAAGMGVDLDKPKPRPLPWYLDLAAWLAESISGLFGAMDSLPRTVMYSAWSVAGTGVIMAAIPQFVPPTLAAEGMALAFMISIPVSILYWMRYDREEQISERMDLIMEALGDLDHVLNEKLDVVVRNV